MICFTSEAFADLKRFTKTNPDREVCGFLLGTERSEEILLEACVLVPNAGPFSGFAITDEETERTQRLARDKRLSVLALFHSHPSGNLALSPMDKQALCRSSIPWIVVTPEENTNHQIGIYAYAPVTAQPIPILIRNT